MKKLFYLLCIILIFNLFIQCKIVPAYKPTQESDTEYDIIYEDEE